MTNREKILKFYGFEQTSWSHTTYEKRASLGPFAIRKATDINCVENDHIFCKVVHKILRGMKKELAKKFLLEFNFYEFFKKQENLEAEIVNPHFITDKIVACDIFDAEFNHYFAILDLKPKKPNILHFSQRNERALDSVSSILRLYSKVSIPSERKPKYISNDKKKVLK